MGPIQPNRENEASLSAKAELILTLAKGSKENIIFKIIKQFHINKYAGSRARQSLGQWLRLDFFQ